MNTVTMYAKDKKGSYKVWEVETVVESIIVRHGKLGGKMQEKVFTAKSKNVGRANSTTAEEQAESEANSRINKQFDKGYRFTIEEADFAATQHLLPMLASDYTKVGHSIVFPCDVSPKLDGVRCIARLIDSKLTFTSRGGKDYKVPNHLGEALVELMCKSNISTLDGELYIHGMSLQNIISCVKKHNEDTLKLTFQVFDVPSDEDWVLRSEKLEILEDLLQEDSPVQVITNVFVSNEKSARNVMDTFLNEGYEGLMLRNMSGKYEWNHRSRDLQKWKDFKDDEFYVTGYEEDNLGEAVYTMDLSDRNGCFKAKPRGSHDYRSVTNCGSFVGKWVTVRYQQLTDDGVPQFPVIVGVRDCNDFGEPTE